MADLSIAIGAYQRRVSDELDFEIGDTLQVLLDDQEYHDGWYYGLNLRTGLRGLYPVVLTQPFQKQNSVYLPTPVKHTITDIDKALEELQSDYVGELPSESRTLTNGNSSSTGSDSWVALEIDSSVGHPVSGETSPQDVTRWTPAQVAKYFTKNGVDKGIADKFEQHKISGRILLELELDHLKEVDIKSFGTRFMIFKEINKLKESMKFGTDKQPALGEPLIAKTQFDDLATEVSALNLSKTPSNQNVTGPSNRVFRYAKNQNLYTSTNQITTKKPISKPPVPPMSPYPDDFDINEASFNSPGKAPKPPSFPSPAQPPLSPALRNEAIRSPIVNGFTTVNHNSKLNMETRSHSGNSNHSTFSDKRHSQSSISTISTNKPHVKADHKKEKSTLATLQDDQDYFSFPGKTERSKHSHGSPATPKIESEKLKRHRKTASGSSFMELYNRVSMLTPTNNASGSATETPQHERKLSGVNTNLHSRNSSYQQQHTRSSSITSNIKKHRRNSSILSFFSSKDVNLYKSPQSSSMNHSRKNSEVLNSLTSSAKKHPKSENHKALNKPSNDVMSPSKHMDNLLSEFQEDKENIANTVKKRTISAEDAILNSNIEHKPTLDEEYKKRGVSEAGVNNYRFRNAKPGLLPTLKKQQTSAFIEGIRTVDINKSIASSDCSGWMSKKGSGTIGTWKNRFFTLHGTRLSYFTTLNDTKERGLIDITSHHVVPVTNDDKLIALYAASVGKGKYCFKLVPPQPGSKKGLTFTQPKVHYFAVDNKDEMRAWIAAITKVTIDRDTSIPAISSNNTPKVSLSQAKEMLARAREEAQLLGDLENDEYGSDSWDQPKRDMFLNEEELTFIGEDSTRVLEKRPDEIDLTEFYSSLSSMAKGDKNKSTNEFFRL